MRKDSSVSAELLLGIPVFCQLPPRARLEIANQASGRWCSAGETVMRRGDASRDVHWVASGLVRVVYSTRAGKDITMRDLGPGDMFGELSAVDERPRSAGVVAVVESLLVVVKAQDFRALLAANEQFMLSVMTHFAGLVRALSERVVEFSVLQVAHRVRAEIVRLAKVDPSNPQRGIIRRLPTHADVASRISSHREAVSREFATLYRLGLIERQHGGIVVPDLEQLRSSADLDSVL